MGETGVFRWLDVSRQLSDDDYSVHSRKTVITVLAPTRFRRHRVFPRGIARVCVLNIRCYSGVTRDKKRVEVDVQSIFLGSSVLTDVQVQFLSPPLTKGLTVNHCKAFFRF